jgi:DNA-binding NarL/FixJ family response regulator
VQLRCLIVDDNISFLAASRAILEGHQLTVVGEATNGAEALMRADELHPDVILLDIDLGEDSGLEVARQLGARSGNSTAKVILISAHPAEDFAELVEESPALGFLSKSELSAGAVGDLLDKANGPQDVRS